MTSPIPGMKPRMASQPTLIPKKLNFESIKSATLLRSFFSIDLKYWNTPSNDRIELRISLQIDQKT
jgi:hypothetical protein